MAALHFSDLQALLPELQSLLKQRLQKIKSLSQGAALPVAQQPVCFDFERQSLLLDLKQCQLFLVPAGFSLPAPFGVNADTAAPLLAVTPSAWVMLARKHLQSHRLISLELVPNDRILKTVWASGAQLLIELTGRHANAFVLDAEGLVLGAWRTDASQRVLRPGLPYHLPETRAFARVDSELSYWPADGSRSAARLTTYQAEQLRLQQSGVLRLALKQAQKQAQQAQGKLQQLEQDLNQVDHISHWQQTADLLQALPDKNRRGQSEVEVLDYYAPELSQRCIVLDPRYTVAEQIARLYQRAHKAERAAERALALWDAYSASQQQSQLRLHQLEALWHKAEDGQPLTAEEILLCLDTPQPLARARQIPKTDKAAEPYRQFCSLTGSVILVGKNDKGNQRVSLQLAKGNDYWFHLQDQPGSHVVLRTNGQAPDQQDLLDAATLAVYYSKLREQAKVAVSYTQAKNLKSLKGGRPGQVLLKTYKTLLLTIEPERLQRLKNSRNP